MLARVAQAVTLSVGGRVIYWSGDASTVIDELPQAAPTHLPALPRVYEKIHGVVTGNVVESQPLKRCHR